MLQAPFPRTTHPADSPRASGGVYRRRLEVCAACERRRGSRCRKSDMLLTLRARRKQSACPLDRWAPVETLPPAFRPNSGAEIRIIDPNAWLTTRQLIDDTAWMNGYLPGDIDAVIGIARSGLIPAQQIACMRHLPLLACRIGWSHAEEAVVDVGNGWRLCDYDRQPFRKLLLVDDTAWHGRSMSWATAVVRRSFPRAQIVRAAVFATSHSQEFLDAWACTYDGLHYLEWNLFNSGHAETLATDFDGILCPDFSTEEDDDGPRYVEALRNRPALQTPRRVAVGAIITARLEKYRRETEAWLAHYGIRNRRLVMGPWATQAERQRADVAAWKSRQFLSTGLDLFVESDPAQAATIHWRTGKKVLCPALGKVLEIARHQQKAVRLNAPDPSASGLPSRNRTSISRLAVVTCHFNPCGYTRPRENYDRFAEGMAAGGVELFTVELAYDDDPFDLPGAQLRIRGRRNRHLLWQKERLLNLLIAKLPAETEAIAWIDADLLFEDATGWAGAALEGLKHWPVLQPWSQCHYLDASGQIGAKAHII